MSSQGKPESNLVFIINRFGFIFEKAVNLQSLSFNPIQDDGQKAPPTSFSLVTSTNV